MKLQLAVAEDIKRYYKREHEDEELKMEEVWFTVYAVINSCYTLVLSNCYIATPANP